MKRVLLAWGLVLSALGCTCPPGTADCDGDCVTLDEDELHCGGCGIQCRGGARCFDGTCVGEAPTNRPCSRDDDCSNDVYCDGRERCLAGYCWPPTAPVACDDGVSCTTDRCDEETRQCVATAFDGRCPAGERCIDLDGTSESGCR